MIYFDQLMKICLHHVPLNDLQMFTKALGKRMRKEREIFFKRSVFFLFIESPHYNPQNSLYLTHSLFLASMRAVSEKMLFATLGVLEN